MGIMSDLQILENISMKNPDVAAEAILHHVREQKRVLDVFALFVLSSKVGDLQTCRCRVIHFQRIS